MANVLFSRTDSPSTKPITDGQIIFDTSGNGKMYLDNGTTRLEMGGAIDVDTTLDATSTNPIQNKGVAGVMLGELEEIRGVTKKGFLTDALATKTLDAKIGTTDISSIGDGTVTGAISDVNGKLDTEEEFVNEGTIVSKTGNHVTLNGSEYIQRVTYTIPGWEMLKIGTMNKKYAPKRGMIFYTNARNTETTRIYYIGVYITPNGDVFLYNAATGDEITFSQIGFSFSWDV